MINIYNTIANSVSGVIDNNIDMINNGPANVVSFLNDKCPWITGVVVLTVSLLPVLAILKSMSLFEVNYKNKIMNAIPNLHSTREKNRVEKAVQNLFIHIFRNKDSLDEGQDLFNYILTLPVDERAQLIQQSNAWLEEYITLDATLENQNVMNSNDIVNDWKVIKNIPEAQREQLIELAKKFTRKDMEVFDRRRILHKLNTLGVMNIPKAQCEQCIQVAKMLITENMSSDDHIHELLEVIFNCVQEPLQIDTLIQAKGLITKQMWFFQIVEILKIIKDIPRIQRNQFIKQVKGCIIGENVNPDSINMSSDHIIEVLKIIKGIPGVQRDRFSALVTGFLSRENVDSDSIIEVLKIIKDIPGIQRDQFIKQAKTFIGKNATSDNILEALKYLAVIPEKERTTFIERLVPLFTQDQGMNIEQKLHVLRIVQCTPASCRNDIIDRFMALAQRRDEWFVTTGTSSFYERFQRELTTLGLKIDTKERTEDWVHLLLEDETRRDYEQQCILVNYML